MDKRMNADKLADALRVALKWDFGPDDLEGDLLCKYETDMAFARKALAEYDAQPAQAAQPVGVPDGWNEGAPDKPWSQEWFIAETTYGDRVVLHALPDGQTYDFTTADQTYIKREKIKRWMQFPDSEFIAPQPPAQPSADAEITDDMVREWMERNDLASVTFGDARTAIEDARSLEHTARAAEGDGK